MPNYNPETGVRSGVIAAHSLQDEVVHDLIVHCDPSQSDEENGVFVGRLDGVEYATFELGGAIQVMILVSIQIGSFRLCSPCVPGTGDLDSPDEDSGFEAYDVPVDWRATTHV